jgi:hypothetical protein
MGAGAAAALLFASVTSGVGLSVVLFYLAPLPIMIVAVGWSHWAGLTAAVAASAMLAGVFGSFFFAMFLASVGLPAWWLGYLALLGRTTANGGAPHMEWYPPGRLVLWAAIIGAAVTTGALATFGGDEVTIRNSLKGALQEILRPQERTVSDSAGRSESVPPADGPQQVPGPSAPADAPAAPAPPTEDTDRVIDMLAQALPPAAAVIAALTQTANLWLAGLVVRLSGRLRRPWPDLAALSFPPVAAGAYGASLGGALLLSGLPGVVASLLAATLTMAFALVGLAVMHAVTRGMRARAAVLWGTYGCVLVLIWPIILMTVIGVAETLFGLRGRFFKGGPPADHNT